MNIRIQIYTKKRDKVVESLQEELDRWKNGLWRIWVLKPEYDTAISAAQHFYDEALEKGIQLSFRHPNDRAIPLRERQYAEDWGPPSEEKK